MSAHEVPLPLTSERARDVSVPSLARIRMRAYGAMCGCRERLSPTDVPPQCPRSYQRWREPEVCA